MPVHDEIQIIINAVPGDEGLADAGLLIGRAQHLHRAAEAELLNGMPQGNGAERGGSAKQVVAAALAGGAVLDGVRMGDVALLGEAGQAVILGVDADDGAAGAVGGHESGGHPALAALHLEAVLFQEAGDQAEGPVFLQAQLGIGPDLISHGVEFLLVLFQPLVHVCLDGGSIHSDSPFQ